MYQLLTNGIRAGIAALLAVVLALFGLGPAFADTPDEDGGISLAQPTGVAVNSDGDLFASSAGENDIFRYDDVSTTVSATLTGMLSPAWSLVIDANDRLYAASGDGLIYYFNHGSTTPDGTLVGPLLPPEECPEEEPECEPDPVYTSLPLYGIAVDAAGNVYAASADGSDEKIFIWDSPGDDALVVPTREIAGIANARGVAVAPNGDVYVGTNGVNNGNDKVVVVPSGSTTVDNSRTINGVHNVESLAFGGADNRLHIMGRLNAGGGSGLVRQYDIDATPPAFASKAFSGFGLGIGMAFEPDDTNDIKDTLWVADWSNGRIERFTPGYVMDLDPSVVTYSPVLVSQSDDIPITVTNAGLYDLVFGANTALISAVEDADSVGFAVHANTCRNLTLTPGNSCSITVRFAPASRGAKQANLTLTPNSPADPEVIPLSGTGIAPILNRSTTELSFSSQLVPAGPTTTQDITISNGGDADLTITAVSKLGDHADHFTLTDGNNCVTTLTPGGTCTVTTAFDPSSRGAKSAFIRFAGAAPETNRDVQLGGTGIAAEFSPTGNGSFGNVATNHQSETRTFTIKNTGDAGMPISAVALTGNHANQFQISDDLCTSTTVTTSVDSSCTVKVTFAPGSTVGAKQAKLRISSSALVGGVGEIDLQGSAIPPTPNSTPDAVILAFDPMIVGSPVTTKTVQITNDGTATLTWGSEKFTVTGHNSFSVTGTTCEATTLEGASCTVTVSYNAAAAQDHSATLVLNNDAATAQSVSLTGKGIQTATAPASVTAAAGNGTATVSWPASANIGNSTVTGHSVQVATNPGGPWSAAPGACSNVGVVTSCLASGLTNGATYYFRVAAINGAGTGTHSAASNAATPSAPAAPPAPPAPPVTPPPSAQVLAKCTKLPAKIKKKGTTVIKNGDCKTNAGANVSHSIKKPGTVKVVKKGKKISLVTKGKKATITITLTAPAVAGFTAFKLQKTYKIK